MSNTSKHQSRNHPLLTSLLQNRPRLFMFLFVILALVLLIASVFQSLSIESLENYDQVPVTRSTVEQTVLGRGVVAPTQVASVTSQLPRDRATIIWMANEGKLVEKGDLIARFDPQVTQNKLEETNRELVEARVKLLNAQKALELRQKEQKGEMESAKNGKEITLLAARDVKYGSGALQRARLEKKIEQSKRRLSLVELEIKDYESIYEQGHISKRELDRALNQKQDVLEELAFAEQEYANFEKYVWPKMLRESELLAEKANKDFQRAVEKAELELERLREEVAVTEANVQRLSQKIKLHQIELERCNVRAPIGGMLLYKKLRSTDGLRQYKIGDKVWKGQALFEIPNTNELMIDTRIRELDITKVQLAQPVDVLIDALNTESIQGKVSSIKRYAQGESHSGEQLFSVHVNVAESEDLLVGMSALVKITTAIKHDVLTIPKAALIYEERESFVHVVKEEQLEKRNITLGLVGANKVEVQSGLVLGDVVTVERF